MNIVFFSENPFNGMIPRNYNNARTEYAWMMALNCPHINIDETPTLDEKFDLGIVIIPKNNPNVDMKKFKNYCEKVAVMQEGPHWYFQDYELPKQFHFYNSLLEADWIYCHNESDVSYYKGLGCKDVRVMRSLMITDGLVPRNEWGDVTIIGGNMVSWYGGFDSFVVARQIGDPIVAPSMGRKQELEDSIEEIQYLPYMSWRDWINSLSQYNIGIHLMRTHAAGTFAMNCGFHGIPCIGYKGLDTQEIIFPNTTIEVGDIESAVKLAKKLKSDDGFYSAVSEEALYRFNEYYTEEKWLDNWKRINK